MFFGKVYLNQGDGEGKGDEKRTLFHMEKADIRHEASGVLRISNSTPISSPFLIPCLS